MTHECFEELYTVVQSDVAYPLQSNTLFQCPPERFIEILPSIVNAADKEIRHGVRRIQMHGKPIISAQTYRHFICVLFLLR